jgi:hypothetical protein
VGSIVLEGQASALMAYLDLPLFITRDRADEAALARLGAATVILWQCIPPDNQNDLLALSSRLGGLPHALNCEEVLVRLIHAHDGLRIDGGVVDVRNSNANPDEVIGTSGGQP